MNKLSVTVTAAALAGAFSLATVAPASADQAAATRNLILGAAAVAAGVVIENNVHKRAVANSVQGYTQSGATVYGDGRVVRANGTSYYPGNNGQSVSCNNGSCVRTGNGGGYNNANGRQGGNRRDRYNR